jgi:hypothetical protein
MKKIYLLTYLMVCCIPAFAQKPQKDSLKIYPAALTAGDVAKLLPQITPKSPNVSALERFGDYPVSMYSGLASIDIPLYEIKVGDISIPIKLMYHGSGNKVNDNASWVGMGWSISGDYTLSRNVRGRADESDFTNNNSLLQNSLPSLPQFVTCLTTQLKSDFNQYVTFGKDIERDIFTYNTPKKSNSFVLTPNQGIVWQEPEKSIFSYTGALQNLTLTDESGTKYRYGNPELTVSSLTGAGAFSAWHITQIQGIKSTDLIKFTYQTNSNFTFTDELIDSEVFHTDISGFSASTIPMGYQNMFTTTDSPGVSSELPKEIIFPMGKVVFVPSVANRQDNMGKSLDTLKIYGWNVSTDKYFLIKKYAFVYAYKQRINSFVGDVVLFLDKVQMLANDNTIIGTYSMSYNTQALPASTSRARDYWGYYNGQTSNTTLLPAFTFNATGYASTPGTITFNVGGANRTVNSTFAQAWILTRITYPTGGFTDFTYESNQYLDGVANRLAGGLRIAKIVSNDGSNITKTKTYKYGSGESGNGTIRSLAFQYYPTIQRIKQPSLDGKFPEFFYNIRTFSSALTRAINANEGSPVTYPIVTEYEDNGTGINGKTIYTFKDDAGDDLITIPSNGKSAQRNRFWNRGQLLSKITYGADGKKKYEQTNTYTTIQTGLSPTIGYLIGQAEIRQLGVSPNSSGCYIDDDNFDPILPITWNYGLVKLSSSEEKYYDNQVDTKFTTKKTETSYSPTHFQPTEIKEYVSNSTILGKLLWYAQDFATIPSTTTVTGEVLALKRMQERNILNTPIEEIDYRKDLLAPAPPDAPPLHIMGGKFTTFGVITGGVSGTAETAIVPKTVSLTECIWNTFLNANNTLNFTPASGLFNPTTHTSTIPRNVNHKPRIYFDQYDTDGNLEVVRQSDGVATRYVYSSNSNDGLTFVYPFSEIQQYLNPNPNNHKSLITNFGFEVPLLGMSFLKEPNNLKTYFEYDTFGRLLQIKDHNLKIVKKYQYKY